jgi:uncharacterized protein
MPSRRVGIGGSARATGAGALIAALRMSPHPEGGHYVETWRDVPADGSRGAGSAILFLLRRREISRWHRVDATEVWHYCGGAPLELAVSANGRRIERQRLGDDVLAGDRPQVVVPAGAWQSARSLGAWTLVGCTVSPAFTFDGFELAPDDWAPGEG